MADRIHLRIPATTGHVGLARATATALAARLDFTYDHLMDLHIGIDEASGRVLAVSDPSARHLDYAFVIQPDGLSISVIGGGRLKPGAEFLNTWSKLILESVAGKVDVLEDGDALAIHFTVNRGGELR